MPSQTSLVLALLLFSQALVGAASDPPKRVDQDEVLIKNCPSEDLYSVRIYEFGDYFVGIYLDAKTRKPVKAIRYSARRVTTIRLPNMKVSMLTVVSGGHEYKFKSERVLGILSSHPDPVPLPQSPYQPK